MGLPETDLASAFDRLARFVAEPCQKGEALFAWFDGEQSEFIRFNRARVRQIGRVERLTARLRLLSGGRQAVMQCTLTGSDHDYTILREARNTLRALIDVSAVDPWLSFDAQPRHEEYISTGHMPLPDEAVDAICSASGDADLVGFFASGPVACGLASSLGHRLFHEHRWYSFEFTVHASGDRAIQDSISATQWDRAALTQRILDARVRARLLERDPVVLSPGEYRVALSARAVADLAGMLAWDGFSGRARVTGLSPLARLWSGEQRLSEQITIRDDLARAGVPRFHELGFTRPAQLTLIEHGQGVDELVCSRSAREFSLQATGATDAESPQGLCIEPGRLRDASLLPELADGLMINQFWYLNHAERASARVTGMTRFATWLVRDGELVAPVTVMRFDDSLYRILGEALLGLGDTSRWFPNNDTWESRCFGGVAAPCALVSAMRFAL